MTLSKLSLRNAKRQARDYLVYFVTLVMAVSFMYAFNNLIFLEEVQTLAQSIAMLPLLIVLASIVVVCIIGWFVSYTTRFMLQRRSREFGTYILIGLENQQVAKLFFLENLIVGGFALVIGILLGSFLFQMMRAIILTLFDMPYKFAYTVSLRAVLLAVLYFLFIYLYAQRKSRRRIRSMKIYDLIYFEKQNEGIVIQTSKKRRKIFTASIVLGVIGTLLLLMGSAVPGILGAGCIIVFLYGFFLSFASGVPAFFEKRPAGKYQGQTLLIFRTLTAKLATVGTLMATISLLFTAVLVSEGTGQCIHAILSNRAKQESCFDLFISVEAGENDYMSDYSDYIEKNVPVKECRLYDIYLNDNTQIMDHIEKYTEYYRYYDGDTMMKFSDYAALRKMLGYPEVTPVSGTYLVHCQYYLKDIMENYKKPLPIGDSELMPGGVYTEYMNQNWSGNGHQYILVVPDEVLADRAVNHRIYAAMTVEPVSEAQYQAISSIMQRIYEESAEMEYYSSFYAGSVVKAEAASGIVMMVFPLYYLALILTMTAAAILTIQQLAETDHYKRQFVLLGKLGMDRREMVKALRGQFIIYYVMPAVPPVLISVPFIYNLGKGAEPGIMIGTSSPFMITLAALALFFFFYAVYIVLAYTGLKRNVLPE